jgi:hypothetical protein
MLAAPPLGVDPRLDQRCARWDGSSPEVQGCARVVQGSGDSLLDRVQLLADRRFWTVRVVDSLLRTE